MAVSHLAGRTGAGPLQPAPARASMLHRPDGAFAAARSRIAGACPDTTAGSAGGTHPWTGAWTGDRLTRADPPHKDGCIDQTGAVCPKLSEARAMQALAELQLTEFNHRWANGLQMIVARIERQQRLQNETIRKRELVLLMDSVQALARLNQYLLPSRTQTHVDLGPLLMNLASTIECATGLLCDVEAEPIRVAGPVAVHLAAAVNELAWNAHKHAYRGVEGGRIRIVCRRDADGRVRLSVADQGVGLPTDFDPRVSEGLGFMVVCATARHFGGELRVESGAGARITLLLGIPGA